MLYTIVTKDVFASITMDKVEEIKKIYSTQCPSIYNQGMNIDYGLLQVIAIGKENNIDYLQNLVDIYDRERVAFLKSNPDEQYVFV